MHGLSAGKDTSSGREKEHAEGLQETGRESMTFSGMSNAVFSGCPAMEAVHFDYAADRNMGGDEVHEHDLYRHEQVFQFRLLMQQRGRVALSVVP